MSRSISEWQTYIFNWADQKGWHDNLIQEHKLTFPAFVALLHSECSEALEEYRKGKPVYSSPLPRNREEYDPNGIAAELADLFIRLAHICEIYGILLEREVELKMEYNKGRDYRHGGKVI